MVKFSLRLPYIKRRESHRIFIKYYPTKELQFLLFEKLKTKNKVTSLSDFIFKKYYKIFENMPLFKCNNKYLNYLHLNSTVEISSDFLYYTLRDRDKNVRGDILLIDLVNINW